MTRPARRGLVEPFHVMEVVKAASARQQSHGDAILLCVGQPGTPAPHAVREAARAAIGNEVLGYTVSTGVPELRWTIATEYALRYGVAVDPEEVLVTKAELEERR